MNFSEALSQVKAGKLIQREGWNGKGMWVALHDGDGFDELPYLYMRTVDDKFVPWLASQTDILAEDWHVLAP